MFVHSRKLANPVDGLVISEFYLFYNLEVVCVPPNKPRIRTDFPPEIYLTKQYKKLALLKEIFRSVYIWWMHVLFQVSKWAFEFPLLWSAESI